MKSASITVVVILLILSLYSISLLWKLDSTGSSGRQMPGNESAAAKNTAAPALAIQGEDQIVDLGIPIIVTCAFAFVSVLFYVLARL